MDLIDLKNSLAFGRSVKTSPTFCAGPRARFARRSPNWKAQNARCRRQSSSRLRRSLEGDERGDARGDRSDYSHYRQEPIPSGLASRCVLTHLPKPLFRERPCRPRPYLFVNNCNRFIWIKALRSMQTKPHLLRPQLLKVATPPLLILRSHNSGYDRDDLHIWLGHFGRSLPYSC